MNKLFNFKFALCCLALGGCTLAPKTEVPQIPAHQSSWKTAPHTKLTTTENEKLVQWQDFIQDKKLLTLVQLALDNNFDLRLASLNVEQARAQYGISIAKLLPTIGVNLQQQRSNSNALTNFKPATNYQVGLGISEYELDFFGRIRSLKDAALADYFTSEANAKTAHSLLITQISKSYLMWSADLRLLAIAKDNLANWQKTANLNQLKFDTGLLSEIELQQSIAQVAAAEAELARLNQQIQADKNSIELLIAQELPAQVQTPTDFAQAASWFSELPIGLPSSVLLRRPDIMAAEYALQAANANIGAARAAFFPSISLTASASKSSSEFNDLLKAKTIWSLIPKINLPIFTGGELSKNLKITKVQQQQTLVKYQKTLQTAFYEVSNILTGLTTWQQRSLSTKQQLSSAQKASELSELSYQHGVLSFLELLNVLRDFNQAQQGMTQVKLGELTNLIDLYQALGIEWQSQS